MIDMTDTPYTITWTDRRTGEQKSQEGFFKPGESPSEILEKWRKEERDDEEVS